MKQLNNIHPPKWSLKLLRFLVKKEYLEEIEGDMEEIFLENVDSLSPRKAKRRYAWEMLKLLRPVLMRNLDGIQNRTPYPMLRNYFKTSGRILLKNPVSSFINIIGLSIAIGLCVAVYGLIHWVHKIDQFHENKNEVYLVTFFADRDGSLQQNGTTPAPLGEMLKQDFTEIRKMCRIEDNNVVLKYEDNVFHEKVRFVDPAFLDMFTFPLKWGASHSLNDINSIILSEDMSIKYFGDENPVGKDLLMIFGADHRNSSGQPRSKRFKVTGVAAAFPKTAAIQFHFLINFENVMVANPDYSLNDWRAFINATIIQVPSPSDLQTIANGMEKYKRFQNEVQNEWAISSFAFEPLAGLYEKSGSITNDISSNSYDAYARGTIFMSIMCLFMLALACFNYINIAIVSAAKRLKEIGVRKAIGATQAKVIIQFLAENVLLTFLALIVGLLFGAYIIVPWLEQINNFNMDFRLADKDLWIFLPAILLFTAFASGIYPAFYISTFQVTRIFNGSAALGKQNPISKMFLGFQLILSCILIVGGVMFTQNAGYIAKRSWGYEPSGVLYVNVQDQFAFERLNAVMAQNPNVLSIAGSFNHLGKNHETTVIRTPDRRYEVQQLSVDAHYFPTMGLKLEEGRFFKDHSETDKQTVVVNEEVVRGMVLKNHIGQQFEIDSIKYEVIGVVADFHSYNFFNKVQPTIFRVAEKEDYRYLSLKVRIGTEIESLKSLQDQWAKLFPEIPFQGGLQEDVWGGYFEYIVFHGKFWRVVAYFAVLLASLGLYGLVTLNVSGRTKEFSIRKVLGAGLKNIATNIINQYWILYAVALVIGAPVSYWLVGISFDALYEYHVPMNYLAVVIAIVLLTSVLLAVISTQVRKVLRSSPVQGLKTE